MVSNSQAECIWVAGKRVPAKCGANWVRGGACVCSSQGCVGGWSHCTLHGHGHHHVDTEVVPMPKHPLICYLHCLPLHLNPHAHAFMPTTSLSVESMSQLHTRTRLNQISTATFGLSEGVQHDGTYCRGPVTPNISQQPPPACASAAKFVAVMSK